MSRKKALAVARALKVKVVQNEDLPASGCWQRGRTIWIHPKRATAYTVLHEVGHVFCGSACCREHAEYMAHGAALALARVFQIRLSPDERRRIDGYAGRSPRKACAAIEQRKKRRRSR